MNDANERLQELIDEYRRCRDEIEAVKAELEPRMNQAKEQIEALMAELDITQWKDETGYARVTPEGVRVSYDNKTLDAMLNDYPFLRGARKETTRKAYVSIK